MLVLFVAARRLLTRERMIMLPISKEAAYWNRKFFDSNMAKYRRGEVLTGYALSQVEFYLKWEELNPCQP